MGFLQQAALTLSITIITTTLITTLITRTRKTTPPQFTATHQKSTKGTYLIHLTHTHGHPTKNTQLTLPNYTGHAHYPQPTTMHPGTTTTLAYTPTLTDDPPTEVHIHWKHNNRKTKTTTTPII